MKVKTSELRGAALDWAVATAEGHEIKYDPMGFGSGANGGYWIWGDGLSDPKLKIGSCSHINYSPSTSWKECGPLIEKFHINFDSIWDGKDSRLFATIGFRLTISGENASGFGGKEFNYLLAACRAVVLAKLGDEIEIPKELCEG